MFYLFCKFKCLSHIGPLYKTCPPISTRNIYSVQSHIFYSSGHHDLKLPPQVTPGVVQRLVENRKLIDELFVKDRLPAQLNMTIRMRNAEKRLNDIQFPFTVSSITTSIHMIATIIGNRGVCATLTHE